MRHITRISELEKKYVNEVLDNSFRSSSNGAMTTRFERAFARVYGSEYAICFSNGTATMHIALEAIGVGPGDEVIVPPLTMSSTALAVIAANATPVFADVDSNTFQIDVAAAKSQITDKTRAIITVALYGGCPDLQAFRDLCNEENLYLIEDNAECFMGYYQNQLVGTYGDFASFSFQSSKHLTSGEGGMLLVKDAKLAAKVRSYQSLGYAAVGALKGKIPKAEIQDPSYARHSNLGWNYRLPELCCAVGLAQVERIEELVNVRINHAKALAEVVNATSTDVFVPQQNLQGAVNSYWTFAGLIRETVGWQKFREKFIENAGHMFYGAWRLSYMEPMFQNMHFLGREKFMSEKRSSEYTAGLCPNAEKIQPFIAQLKTNYWSEEDSKRQCEALYKTLIYFN